MINGNPILACDTFDGLLCLACSYYAGADCDGADRTAWTPVRASDFQRGWYTLPAKCDECGRQIFPEGLNR